LGRKNLIYFMGGVENWILPVYNDEISPGRDPDYSFKAMASNMRGFPQNIRNGYSFGVWNSEIRWSFYQYFHQWPVKSEFLRDLQLVVFSDFGTAWRGLTPRSDDNVIGERIITTGDNNRPGPLVVIVSPIRDPYVWGHGFGFRSNFLGYYIKVDFGWGREGLYLSSRQIHISLGKDF
jgi:hypothetical protein